MTASPPLSLLEEFLLLALNERTGQFYPLDPQALNRATAGAILMDLSLRNRIDNDLRDMFTVDPTPTGDDILDPVLLVMSQAPVLTPYSNAYWLKNLAEEAEIFRKKALSRLEKREILRQPSPGFFWMFGLSSPPVVDETKVRAIKSDLLGVIYSNEIPTPRGVMLTGLAEACGLFRHILNETEAQDAAPRIAAVSRQDIVGQLIGKDLAEAEQPLATASGSR